MHPNVWPTIPKFFVLCLSNSNIDPSTNFFFFAQKAIAETFTAMEGEAKKWTIDGRVVKVTGFEEHKAEKGSAATAGSLTLKLSSDKAAAGDAEEKVELTLADGNTLTAEDKKKYSVAEPALKNGTEVTLASDDKIKYTVEDFKAEAGKVDAHEARFTATQIEEQELIVEFQLSNKKWTGTSGDIKFEQSEEEFEKLGKDTKEIEVTHLKTTLKYKVNEEPVEAADGKKTVKLINAAAMTVSKPVTFEKKNEKMMGVDGDVQNMELSVVERAEMSFKSDKNHFETQARFLAYIKQEAVNPAQEWFFEKAAEKDGASSYMMYVYIGLGVLAVAVICFFVFGGKKDTESDDESDLDTSDDEEEDAAATEAKEEEA